jgi:hypothetical protein
MNFTSHWTKGQKKQESFCTLDPGKIWRFITIPFVCAQAPKSFWDLAMWSSGSAGGRGRRIPARPRRERGRGRLGAQIWLIGGQAWCQAVLARGIQWWPAMVAAPIAIPTKGWRGRGNERHEKVPCKGVESWGSSVAASDTWKREFTRRPPMADRGAACSGEGVAGVSRQAAVQALVGAWVLVWGVKWPCWGSGGGALRRASMVLAAALLWLARDGTTIQVIAGRAEGRFAHVSAMKKSRHGWGYDGDTVSGVATWSARAWPMASGDRPASACVCATWHQPAVRVRHHAGAQYPRRVLQISSRGSCDNPPRKIPYYRLNQSLLH